MIFSTISSGSRLLYYVTRVELFYYSSIISTEFLFLPPLFFIFLLFFTLSPYRV